ncbi:hypothetical protein VZC37_18130 [Gordonia sp. LSe1-13]|uniref:Toxin n=1 Tax=Gordonia sesuvii TaxID=3116777 RepID=A0ABU7MGL8_9ACTN|nr:hypothetical protein [Gordonia sp. LSe1-13]
METSTSSPQAAPRRLRIVGVAGSGKSHLARDIAQRLDLARLELDAVFWDADWTLRDLDEALDIVHDFVTSHPAGWVIDGNWTSRLGGHLDPGTRHGADVVVWLDHSRCTTMRRIVTRTVRRGILRRELWHGNRESPWWWLHWDPERNIVRWTWVKHPEVRARMERMIAAGTPVVRLRTQTDVDEWLAATVAQWPTTSRSRGR